MTETIRAVTSNLRPVAMAAAVSLIVCGVFLTVIESRNNDRLYRNQIEACERGQKLRTTVHEALVLAEEAMGMKELAREFARLDGSVWPLTPCVEIVKHP